MVATPFTSAQAAFSIASSGPGRLLGVQIAATGTGVITIYDNPSAASGNIIFGTGASPTANAFIQAGGSGVGIPYNTGLWGVFAASSPAGTILTSPGTPNDGRPAV
jgi:hypothetical protein